MIVSVSRRCDIPRFQFNRFMENLDAGFVEVANPFNANQIKRVSLLPGANGVDAFVFWTRDPRHILANADELSERGFPFYVMVTVTGYPVELEPDMVRTQTVLTAMKELSRKIGQDRVIWRYDPVLLTDITDEGFHRKNFFSLADNLAGSVWRVIISIYDEYRGAKVRLAGLEKTGVLRLLDTPGGFANGIAAGLAELLTGFAEGAKNAGMEIQSCAEEGDFSPYGIKPGACIDAGLINKLWGLELKGKDKNQRPHCLCCKSVDIGGYGICAAHCVYCYAW
jgi:hypothetical protein